MEVDESKEAADHKKKDTFYTHASEELVNIRIELSKETFERAHERLLNTRKVRESEALQTEEDLTL